MKEQDFLDIFFCELSMTKAWLKSKRGECSCLQLFQTQAELGFNISIQNQVLSGYIGNWIASAGFHHGKVLVCFHLRDFIQKFEHHAPYLTSDQRLSLEDMMIAWQRNASGSDYLTYLYDQCDLEWLPSISEVLHLGISGLYDLYRTEDPAYARHIEFINILNNAIDQYKYIACRSIVKESQNTYAEGIYSALGRIKYLPPKTMKDALHLLLLYSQIFRSTKQLAWEQLLPFYEYDMLNAKETSLHHQHMLDEFVSKYRFSVQTLGKECRPCLIQTTTPAFDQLINRSIDA